MRRQFLTLLVLCLTLCGCARFHIHPKTTNIPGLTPQNQATYSGSFNRIKIIGRFEVNLHTHQRAASVTFHGPQYDLNHVKWYIANHELVIRMEQGYQLKEGLIYIDVNTPHLTSFSYQGSGSVSAQSLSARSLDLSIKNNGPTRLEGDFTLHQALFGGKGVTHIKGAHGQNIELTLTGRTKVQILGTIQLSRLKMKNQAWLSAHWLKSSTLIMRLRDQTYAQLAGSVDFLDVALRDQARFNGRYLRAQRAFAKTQNQSEADIDVVKAQHSLASGTSNIYFYDLPTMRADFMAENGSVLDMREWERPFFKEGTNLNQ